MRPLSVSPRLRRALPALGATALVVAVAAALPDAALAQSTGTPPDGIRVELPGGDDPGTTLSLLAVFTLITLGPSLLIMMTGFARILIVLGFLRSALGTPSMPPNQILVGFSLFLTLFVMGPTFEQMNDRALQPYLEGTVSGQEALERAEEPIRTFMLRQTGSAELGMFVRLSRQEAPSTPADVELTTLIPAFMVSEVKTAFTIGFLIYIPFLIIDMVVASTLMSMGMMMLPPQMISLPFKLLLFVLVDGWALLAQSLVAGFGT